MGNPGAVDLRRRAMRLGQGGSDCALSFCRPAARPEPFDGWRCTEDLRTGEALLLARRQDPCPLDDRLVPRRFRLSRTAAVGRSSGFAFVCGRLGRARGEARVLQVSAHRTITRDWRLGTYAGMACERSGFAPIHSRRRQSPRQQCTGAVYSLRFFTLVGASERPE